VKVLIAEDDPISALMLQEMLAEWGYEVRAVGDGAEAWRAMQAEDAPRLAILDWVMPGLDGVEVCRRVKGLVSDTPAYVILLTSRDAKADVVAGLDAGANDYLTKPFDREELRARVGAGRTVVELQAALAGRLRELEDALSQVKQLSGLLPICCYCKKIRDDKNYWQQIEEYFAQHSDARFSHGICPDCFRDVVEPELRASPFSPSS
jgi:DNA-binding response OmpR family regulator